MNNSNGWMLFTLNRAFKDHLHTSALEIAYSSEALKFNMIKIMRLYSGFHENLCELYLNHRFNKSGQGIIMKDINRYIDNKLKV